VIGNEDTLRMGCNPENIKKKKFFYETKCGSVEQQPFLVSRF